MTGLTRQTLEQLRKLLKPTETPAGTLPAPRDGRTIDESVFTSVAPTKPGGGGVTSVRFEVAFIYSDILVMEDGAFEYPPGWPDDNTYPGFSAPEDDLPLQGGTYLVQRRVHAFLYYLATKGELEIHHLLARYEKPFPDTPVAFPPTGLWLPTTKVATNDALNNIGGSSVLQDLISLYQVSG